MIGSIMAIVSEWDLPRQDSLYGVVMYNPDYAESLEPAGRFSDEYATDEMFFNSRARFDDPADRGVKSKALRVRVATSMAGWRQPPSGKELYEAIHASRPTTRQKVLIRAWEAEADDFDLFGGFQEQAYSLRQLVAALHRAGVRRCRAASFLNQFARKANE